MGDAPTAAKISVCIFCLFITGIGGWHIGYDDAASDKRQERLESQRETSRICDYIESLHAGTDEELGSTAYDRKSLCVGAIVLKQWGEKP